jgi:D-glycero-alpha-D-manno-heptose 1-phosphate guanylyltransferase
VVNLPDVSRYGQSYMFDDDKRITAFAEKSGQCAAGWINAGLCHLNAELFKNWDGKPMSLERDMFSDLVKKHHLAAVPLKIDFIDIGVPNDYHRFCRWVAAGRQSSLCN